MSMGGKIGNGDGAVAAAQPSVGLTKLTGSKPEVVAMSTNPPSIPGVEPKSPEPWRFQDFKPPLERHLNEMYDEHLLESNPSRPEGTHPGHNDHLPRIRRDIRSTLRS